MAFTMLQMVQQVIAEMGTQTVPTAVASSTNQDIVQILALMNAVGYELQREHQWQGITKEYRFTTEYLTTTGTWTDASYAMTAIPDTSTIGGNSTWQVVGAAGINQDVYVTTVDSATQVTMSQYPNEGQTASAVTFAKTKYAMPSDYDRLIDGTQWDKTKHWQMIGPETMQQKEWLKSGYISTGPRIRYYLQGGTFQVWPPMSTNEYLGFDYVSNYWVTATGSLNPDKASFTADTDTCIFPARLMVIGTKLKYFEVKGFDTTALYRDYTMQKDIAKASDAGSPTLSMAPIAAQVLINWNNIPDSNFGS